MQYSPNTYILHQKIFFRVRLPVSWLGHHPAASFYGPWFGWRSWKEDFALSAILEWLSMICTENFWTASDFCCCFYHQTTAGVQQKRLGRFESSQKAFQSNLFYSNFEGWKITDDGWKGLSFPKTFFARVPREMRRKVQLYILLWYSSGVEDVGTPSSSLIVFLGCRKIFLLT